MSTIREVVTHLIDLDVECGATTPVMVHVEGMPPLQITRIEVEHPGEFEGNPDSIGSTIWLHAEET